MSTKTKYWLSLIGILAAIIAVVMLAILPASVRAAKPGGSLQAACALLDDPAARGKMSAQLEARLLTACGRKNELGAVLSDPGAMTPSPLGADVMVNDPSGDSGVSQTQSETSIALNENTGAICSGYNDSYSGVVTGQGYTGISRSGDGGLSFTDLGGLSSHSYGDPSMIWRRSDGYFYIATLHDSGGLGIWRSTDDCQSFAYVGLIHSGYGDDKELMVADNNPASPHYGRMYVAWTDFGAGARIRLTYSDNATSWSAPIYLSSSGVDVQGAWPTVAPSGEVYIGWVRWNPYYSGPIDIEIARSTDGGVSASLVTNPMSGKINPYQSSATGYCGRPALNGKIRYLPSPQLSVSPDGCLHVVYTYDPDGRGVGDDVNVYYRRSCDNGATWSTEIQLNDDGTTTDQFFPTVSVGATGVIASTWYDRRLDTTGNMLFDYYFRYSSDGGNTWNPSTRVSDVSSPVYLDPNLATCYHGDYDQQLQFNGEVYVQWSDDRSIHSGHNDPDVWFDKQTLFPDFTLSATPSSQDLCAGVIGTYDVTVGQVMGYTSPVTLSASGLPTFTKSRFTVNPVTPPGSSVFGLRAARKATAGNYTLTITGTSADFTHSTTVGLNLFTAAPGAVTLLSPANGATGVALSPTFEWTAATQGGSYDLIVASDPGFSNIVYTASVSGTSHTAAVVLDPETQYFWRVRPTNACGNGGYSARFRFTTRGVPPLLLVDDDDNGPDVRAYYADALTALGFVFDVWDTANSDNEPDAATLSQYKAVVWFTGVEYGGFAGPGATGETALATYLDGGGCFFISGQDYYYDRGLTSFMSTYLGVASATSDVSQTKVGGRGSVFSGLGPYTLSYPFSNYSDTILAASGAEMAFLGDKGSAAVDKTNGAYYTTFLGYPLEAIPLLTDRQAVLNAFFTWCGVTP